MTAPRKHRPAGYHIIELYVYAEREYIIRFWSLCQSFAPGNGHQSRIIELGLSECLSVKSRTSDWIWTFEGRDRILVNEIDMLHLDPVQMKIHAYPTHPKRCKPKKQDSYRKTSATTNKSCAGCCFIPNRNVTPLVH
jgi:hypothetical protein